MYHYNKLGCCVIPKFVVLVPDAVNTYVQR